MRPNPTPPSKLPIPSQDDQKILAACRAGGEDPEAIARTIRGDLLRSLSDFEAGQCSPRSAHTAMDAVQARPGDVLPFVDISDRPARQTLIVSEEHFPPASRATGGIVVWRHVGELTTLRSVAWAGRALRAKMAMAGVAVLLGVSGLVFLWNSGLGRRVGAGAAAGAVPAAVYAEQAKATYEIAVTHMRASDYDRAIAGFTKAIRANPKLTEAYYNRGVCYMNTAKHEDAIADFSLVIERDPANTRARYNRAVSYMNLEKAKPAVDDLNVVIQRAPTLAAYRNRARARATLGDSAGADADFAAAERLDQKH